MVVIINLYGEIISTWKVQYLYPNTEVHNQSNNSKESYYKRSKVTCSEYEEIMLNKDH